jgi:hypothetical protein
MNNLILSCSFPGPRSIVIGSDCGVTTVACTLLPSFDSLVTVVVAYLSLPFLADTLLLSGDRSSVSTNLVW